MEFFDYKPETVPGLKTSRVRFPETRISHVAGSPSTITITPERYITYADGRVEIDPLPVCTEVATDAGLSRSITLYHPGTGAVVGSFTAADYAAMTYSLQIDIFNRNSV